MFAYIIGTVVGFVVGVGGTYWYVHKKNPDVAQKATDTLVEGVKADAQAAVDQINPVKHD